MTTSTATDTILNRAQAARRRALEATSTEEQRTAQRQFTQTLSELFFSLTNDKLTQTEIHPDTIKTLLQPPQPKK